MADSTTPLARRWLACLLAAGALVPAGCGGNDPEEPPAKPALKVPGGDSAPPDGQTTTDETTTGDSTTTEPEPVPEPEPTPTTPDVSAPTPEPTVPDSPANDTPPPPNTAADRFEDFCKQNPGAC